MPAGGLGIGGGGAAGNGARTTLERKQRQIGRSLALRDFPGNGVSC